MKSNKRRLLSNKKLHNIYNLKSLKKHRIKQKSAHRPKQFKFKQSGGYKSLEDARRVYKSSDEVYAYFNLSGARYQQYRYWEYFHWLLDFSEAVFGPQTTSNMLQENHALRSKDVVTKFEGEINDSLNHGGNDDKISNEELENKYAIEYRNRTNNNNGYLWSMISNLETKYTEKKYIKRDGKITESNILKPDMKSGHDVEQRLANILTTELFDHNAAKKTKPIWISNEMERFWNDNQNPESGSSLAVTAGTVAGTAGNVAGACTDRVLSGGAEAADLEGELLVAVKLSDLNKESNEITLKCDALIEYLKKYKPAPAPGSNSGSAGKKKGTNNPNNTRVYDDEEVVAGFDGLD